MYVYALYKSIFQYGLLVWGGCSDNAIKPLVIQQNHAVRLCLRKKELYGSTSVNYKEFRVLPVSYLYRQFSILFKAGKINTTENVNKREHRAYDLQVSYTKKNIGNKFVDYLGSINFNAMPLELKKNIVNNVYKNDYVFKKKTIVNWLLLNL